MKTILVKFKADGGIGETHFLAGRVYNINEKEARALSGCYDLPDPKKQEQAKEWKKEIISREKLTSVQDAKERMDKEKKKSRK